MKAIVEIKTANKLEDVAVVPAGTEKYNSIVNDILQDKDFEVTDVQIFNGYADLEKEYTSMEIAEETFITVVIDLELEEINHFKLHENTIINKAMNSLSSRELDIVSASEFGKRAFIHFNKE